MMAVYMWIILLLQGACFDVILAVMEANAVLLECEKGSSKDDIKRVSPPYHTIDECIRKIRVTLNVTNSGKTPPDLDYLLVSEISDPVTGVNMYLLNPVVIRLRQDQVLLAYPFNYLSAVNAKATEIVVNYQNRKNFTVCDDMSKINPTCGLKHVRGKAVPFSEGFCCFCPEAPVKENQPRGGQDCSLDVGDPANVEKQKYKASAHCLHLDDIWYTVSAINEPSIIHETYIQVYNQKHLKNGSSVWVALTHNEDFELGSKNPFQYDENKTIIISYLTSNPKDSSVAIPFKDRRLLTPQLMPAVELSKLPTPVKNGAKDYLLLPKTIINSDGDVCDVAGIFYEAFAGQPDRCNAPKDTCLKNQPFDFWEMDDTKRKSGEKGIYLLENYGTPYKDPIIVHPETKEHWLALEYFEPHVTVLFIEINADEISILAVGRYAQISKLMSSYSTKTINIHVNILNTGLLAAKYSVQAVKCAFGVPDSTNESAIIPPQMTQDFKISSKPGSTTLDEQFDCTVQVSSSSYGVVASRKVTIDPLSRCVCNFHCECACLRDNLKCEAMSEEDYHAAGFRGSLPVLTAKPPYRIWFLKHPFLALLALILLLLLLGFIKGLLGLAGYKIVGRFGMDKCLYQPKKIKKYPQQNLKKVNVMYDSEGYPINPDTKERVEVIGEELLFAFNVLFFFFWPCLMCKSCILKVGSSKYAAKLKKKKTVEDGKDEDSKAKGKKDEPKTPPKKWFWQKGKDSPKETNPGKMESGKGKSKIPSGERLLGTDKSRHKGFRAPRKSVSDSDVEKDYISNPVANPLKKEQQQWQKGKSKVQAVTK